VAAPNLLLLDEPTNHLDLTTREALSMALNEFEGTVMLVSHDRALLREVCDEFCWSPTAWSSFSMAIWTTTRMAARHLARDGACRAQRRHAQGRARASARSARTGGRRCTRTRDEAGPQGLVASAAKAQRPDQTDAQ